MAETGMAPALRALDRSKALARTLRPRTQTEKIARNPKPRHVMHRCPGKTSRPVLPEAETPDARPGPRQSGIFPREAGFRSGHGQDTGAVSPQRCRQGGVRRRRRELAQRPAPQHRRHVGQVRLRPGHLRRVHRADRRRAAAGLPNAGRDLRRPRHRDCAGSRRGAEPASVARSLHGALRGPVRLLHARAC